MSDHASCLTRPCYYCTSVIAQVFHLQVSRWGSDVATHEDLTWGSQGSQRKTHINLQQYWTASKVASMTVWAKEGLMLHLMLQVGKKGK